MSLDLKFYPVTRLSKVAGYARSEPPFFNARLVLSIAVRQILRLVWLPLALTVTLACSPAPAEPEHDSHNSHDHSHSHDHAHTSTQNAAADSNVPALSAALNQNPLVVVSSNPLFLIAEAVTKGSNVQPIRLFDASSSHHASLAPKQAAALKKANLVVWSGASMDHALAGQLANNQHQLNAAHTLPLKAFHGSTQPNPHFWFDPELSSEFAAKLASELSRISPEQADLFSQNAQSFDQTLKEAHFKLTKPLEQQTGQSAYLAYHDAFGYLEAPFKLKFITALSMHDEPIVPTRLVEAVKLSKPYAQVCVLSTADKKPAALDSQKFKWVQLSESFSQQSSFIDAYQQELKKVLECHQT